MGFNKSLLYIFYFYLDTYQTNIDIKPYSQENRVRYNQCNYRRVFEERADEHRVLESSESDPSLSECVQRWLERTPGLEEHGFNFPAKFKAAVENIFDQEMKDIQVAPKDVNFSISILGKICFYSNLYKVA